MGNSLLVQGPDLGLSFLKPDNAIDPRGATSSTHNIIYERGFLRSADGFAKVDLTTIGLGGGENVLGILPYNELDGAAHLLAVTDTNIYEHDVNNATWTARLPSDIRLSATLQAPVSSTVIAHDGSAAGGGSIHLDENANKSVAYYHCIVSDGGNSDVVRWAGRKETNFHKLNIETGILGDATTLRADYLSMYQNRLIALVPYIYSSSTKIWSSDQTRQRVQYPQVGKLETWNGTGAGFVDLLDTGGYNMAAGLLGGQLVVYQDRGIWTLRHVGGTAVFSPYPYIADIGLIAPHMFVNKNNVHFLMAKDYNIYAYHGGSTIKPVGDAIRDQLESELSARDAGCHWTKKRRGYGSM
jgi:hypothetical protein